jgi:hypothetical protein
MGRTGTTDELVDHVLGHGNLEGCNLGLLRVIAEHWDIDHAGMWAPELRVAIRDHENYPKGVR